MGRPHSSSARLAGLCSLAALATWSARGQACEELYPWSRLERTASHYAQPVPLALTGAALLTPALMAPTGADYELRLVAQDQLGGSYDAESVSVIVPYALPIALVLVDLAALPLEACEVARPTSAMLQAVALAAAGVGLSKLVTGRPFPNAGQDPTDPERVQGSRDLSDDFYWFDPARGWAFPSGHTAVMFAAASSLATLGRHRSVAGYVAYGLSAGVAAGMWLGDHHWASDIVSGALFGFAVGQSVGQAFAP
ncbi:MAG TPA: phosphatase PAP2 family protein, partial [Polyangiaceae bacterium]|nr:phosphatase PAP2 family protein [Polyangiaceae bacterium]